jgi:hypothetical protein
VLLLQARVLAARDHSGAVPLLEGRTAAGSLIIACGTFLPEGVHQMVDIQPGKYFNEDAGSACGQSAPWRALQCSRHLVMFTLFHFVFFHSTLIHFVSSHGKARHADMCATVLTHCCRGVQVWLACPAQAVQVRLNQDCVWTRVL